MVWDPVTASVDPLNVKLALSSNSPEEPAITTRLSVRSLIFAVPATRETAPTAPAVIVPDPDPSPE